MVWSAIRQRDLLDGTEANPRLTAVNRDLLYRCPHGRRHSF